MTSWYEEVLGAQWEVAMHGFTWVPEVGMFEVVVDGQSFGYTRDEKSALDWTRRIAHRLCEMQRGRDRKEYSVDRVISIHGQVVSTSYAMRGVMTTCHLLPEPRPPQEVATKVVQALWQGRTRR